VRLALAKALANRNEEKIGFGAFRHTLPAIRRQMELALRGNVDAEASPRTPVSPQPLLTRTMMSTTPVPNRLTETGFLLTVAYRVARREPPNLTG